MFDLFILFSLDDLYILFGQIKKDKQKNNDLQNITQKTKDGARRTPLQIGGELRCSERISSSCSTCGTRCVVLTFYILLDSYDYLRHVWNL
jgi:hypothetical protein